MNIEINIEDAYIRAVSQLPWHAPLEQWDNFPINKLSIKSGLARHPVVFVRVGEHKFAIKETNAHMAKKEIRSYEKLLALRIPTLTPIGHIVRHDKPLLEKTPFGIQKIENQVGYTVTLLAERVLPDSRLFGRAFTIENKNKIWNAVARLFATIHSHGVFWGDASLANMLIHFGKERVPKLGQRTVLQAILADAETVEFPTALSDALRQMDLDYFFESMDWITEDLRASGINRELHTTAPDKAYIQARYDKLIEIEHKQREFEAITGLQVRPRMGQFGESTYGEILLKHIDTHKWYLNQQRDGEVTLRDAVWDWYRHIFIPVSTTFREENLLELFPGKTAVDLYVEIMDNKYYLSEQMGQDVGFIYAMRDFCHRFGVEHRSPGLLKSISNAILKILGNREQHLLDAFDEAVA